jgi:hypothetical protein
VDLYHAREHLHSLTRSLEFMLLDRKDEWLAARLEDLDYGDIDGIETARCWEYNWVIDLDIRKFFNSVRWDLQVKAVEADTGHETRWVVLYVKRWLAAPLQLPDGTVQERDRGTPQGQRFRPCSPTCSCTTRSMSGLRGSSRWSGSRGTRTTP